MPRPMTAAALLHIIGEVIRRNRVRDGLVYLQVTRGAGPRDFAFPDQEEILPTIVVLGRSLPRSRGAELAETGISVKTMPDNRWGRCDIKTVMLLPAVLAKDAAYRAGAREAWFIDASGRITEGASSNAWIVTNAGVLVTRQLGREILPGVTRATVMDVASLEGLKVEERPFTREEALKAKEAFVTSATNLVMPVTFVDGLPIGDGRPGPLARRLRRRFHQLAEISPV
jgi:D-alanine transaminase